MIFLAPISDVEVPKTKYPFLPKLQAISFPIPLVAPVTTAIFLSNRKERAIINSLIHEGKDLYRNSGSPADNDEVGNIAFNGRNDNSQDVKYAEIETYIRDASDGTEDGMFNFNTIVAGSVSSRMKLDTSETIFNDDSTDLDFRVEGNSDANLLFVEAGTDRVGIGTNSPGALLDVDGTLDTTNLTIAGAQGSDGQVLTSTGSGVGWEDAGGGISTGKAIAMAIVFG